MISRAVIELPRASLGSATLNKSTMKSVVCFAVSASTTARERAWFARSRCCVARYAENVAITPRTASVTTTPALRRCIRFARAMDALINRASSSLSSRSCSSSDSASTRGLPEGSSRSEGRSSFFQRPAAAAMRLRILRFSRFCATQSLTRGQCQSNASCATVTTAVPSSASSVTNSRFFTKVSISSRLLPVVASVQGARFRPICS